MVQEDILRRRRNAQRRTGKNELKEEGGEEEFEKEEGELNSSSSSLRSLGFDTAKGISTGWMEFGYQFQTPEGKTDHMD